MISSTIFIPKYSLSYTKKWWLPFQLREKVRVLVHGKFTRGRRPYRPNHIYHDFVYFLSASSSSNSKLHLKFTITKIRTKISKKMKITSRSIISSSTFHSAQKRGKARLFWWGKMMNNSNKKWLISWH